MWSFVYLSYLKIVQVILKPASVAAWVLQTFSMAHIMFTVIPLIHYEEILSHSLIHFYTVHNKKIVEFTCTFVSKCTTLMSTG